MTPYYDSMLAKLVSWGSDRQACIARMSRALESFPVIGVTTNIPFLRRVLEHPLVREGRYDTGFLEDHFDALGPHLTEETELVAQALAAWVFSKKVPSNASVRDRSTLRDSASPWHQAGPWRMS